MNALKSAAKIFSPKFYVDYFHCVVSSTRKSFAAGSPAPLFKGMLVVGVVGYVMEYTQVGSKLMFCF